MSLNGYADLHCHPMSHLGFGGATVPPGGKRLFWGTPDVETGDLPGQRAEALPCCSPSHVTGQLLSRLVDPRHGEGYPKLDWPRHDTILHQQMYFEWMKRAWKGGLRLICALAVHNRFLARLYEYPAGTDLSDSTAVRAQLAGMTAYAARQREWMEIVLSPAAARQCIEAGKLAVVLGVEVDSLGDWRAESDTTATQVRQLVQQLHADGVRTVTPIHLANNAFGGCAVYTDPFNLLNHFLGQNRAHHFYEVRTDPNDVDGVQYLLDKATDQSAFINAYLELIRQRPSRREMDLDYPDYERLNSVGHRNARGLTSMGRELVGALMRQGMLVDVDHMSDLSRDSVLDLAEAATYPVYSSHTRIRDLGLSRAGASAVTLAGVRHEGMLTRKTMERIRDLKGMVAPQTNMGPTLAPDPRGPASPVSWHSDTSLSWAQGYLYCTSVMKGSVAIGTDFNGFAQQPGARFTAQGVAGPARKVNYGSDRLVGSLTQEVLQRYQLGDRVFDFNDLGLAHYGLLPDFLRDVVNIIGDEAVLDPFFTSAARFIEMWQRCEDTAPTVSP